MSLPESRLSPSAGIVAVLSALAYGVLSVRQFAQYNSPSWDNAIFEQVVASYSRLDAPRAHVKMPDFMILGDHFSPIVALIAPVYRLVPAAQTLLIAQVVLIALSVYVITALAVRHLGRWVGLALGVAYAVSFGVQSAVAAEFHEVAFAAPLLALAGAAYVERRWPAVAGWSLLLLLVKEDLGLTVAVIGAVVWLAGERRRGMLLAVIGAVGFLLTVFVIIPAFADGGYVYTDNVGGSPFTALDTKAWTLLLTFAITGFAALLSPWALLVLPTLAWRFTGNVEYYWGTEWHYSLVLMPIVFVAAIDAMRRHDWLRWSIPVAAVVALVSLPSSPLAGLADPELYRESSRAEAARGAVDAVPEGASVESDITGIAHLVSDHETYWYGTISATQDRLVPDAILFDTWRKLGSPLNPAMYAEQEYGGKWETIYDRAGFRVAVRQD